MKQGKRFKGAARETYLGALEVTVNGGRKDAAIYWGSDKKFGTISVTEAQELIEVLQAIIADYPKEPTNEEILKELPVGSVVELSNYGGESIWFKTFGGYTLCETGVTRKVGSKNFVGKITVKYRGDE